MPTPPHSRAGLLTLAFVALLVPGCSDPPAGPSLAAVSVTGLTPANLRPTDSDPNACCCRATGRAVNGSSVPVHVSLKIAGYGSQADTPLSTVFYFINDLQPNAAHDIDASGFVVPCRDIEQMKLEVAVRSVDGPQ